MHGLKIWIAEKAESPTVIVQVRALTDIVIFRLMLRVLVFACVFCVSGIGRAQDTFSILAFDSLTREVGAAGASCVDLFGTPLTDDFIAEIFPDTGAIVCQAGYIPQNQTNARTLMLAGLDPLTIIGWLTNNDVQGTPEVRQYAAVHLDAPVHVAAFTGSSCLNYAGNVNGLNYSMQGNILLNKSVIDSMEARFLREPGDLACKLMAALQGAKRPGADSRCASNNSSALFAFLKVSSPWDTFGHPSLLLSVRTHSNDFIEPIDSLQKQFDIWRSCTPITTGLKVDLAQCLRVTPNPAMQHVSITGYGLEGLLQARNVYGQTVGEWSFRNTLSLNTEDWPRGLYFLDLRTSEGLVVKKLVLD